MAALKPAARPPSEPIRRPVPERYPAIARPSRHWWLAIIWLVVLGLMSTTLFTFPRTWALVAAVIQMVAPGGVSEAT